MAEGKGQRGNPLIELCAGLCCFSAFIIAIAVILSGSDKNCDNPIREWLIVWVVVNSTSIIIGPVTRLAMANKSCPKSLVFPLQLILICLLFFNIAWIIVGSVWLYTDDDCYDDFYDMWALTLAILIISYIGLGCCVMVCCCLCVVFCVKGKSMMKKSKEAEEAVVQKALDEIVKSVEAPAEAEAPRKKKHKKKKHVEEDEPVEREDQV